jgi:hypothetical protein
VAAALPLTSALSGQFLWTDTAEVLEEGIIRGPAGLLAAVAHGIDGQYYRPAVFLLHSLSHWVFGPSALAFRGMNLAMHAVNAILTMALWTTLGVERRLGRDAALLFAAHPVAVTAVSWASDRTDLLAFSGAVLAVILARRFESTGRWRWLAAVAIAVLVGLAAKENTAAVVVFLAASAGMANRSADRRRRFVAAALAAAVCLCWFAWRTRVSAESAVGDPSLSPGMRVALAAKIHLDYAGELLAPWSLRVCDDVFVPAPAIGWLIVGIGVAAAAAWFLVRRRSSAAALPLAWALSFLLPTAGLLFTLKHARADRYLYLALPGVLLLARMAVEKLGRRSVTAVVAGTYLALASLSVARAAWFRDDRTLWTHETTRSATCREGHANLARVSLVVDHDPTAALEHAARALARPPGLLAYVNETGVQGYRAVALLAAGKEREARPLFATLAAGPSAKGRAEAHYHLGIIALGDGQPAAAARELEKALEEGPVVSEASRDDYQLLRAYALLQAGNRAAARAAFPRLRLDHVFGARAQMARELEAAMRAP